MKNSLAMLGQAHAQWLAQLPEELRGGSERGVIEYEFARLNGMLVQLLGLYKLGVNQLPLRPGYQEVEDFICAQLARHDEVLHSRSIAARCEVEEFDLMGFFDQELLGSVVANVIANSIRYARSALLISAREEDGQLLLSINDDGVGYPTAMLDQQADYVLGLNQSSGSTGLGLYFAARIAELHERNGVRGRIELRNGGPLGGGEFRIYLP
jgi:K+-sensing histidine kinase KdpD